MEERCLLSVFTVDNTTDSGAGSLRQAILDANAAAGLDQIAFNISGSGVQTISPNSPLPAITSPVVIDGYTQPGASANTNGPGLGSNAVLQIELNGTSASNSAHGLNIKAAGSTVRGLVINRFAWNNVNVDTAATGTVIEVNFLGTNAAGTASSVDSFIFFGEEGNGVRVWAANVTIGGTTPAARNIISGNKANGVSVQSTSNVLIVGNFIGSDKTGTVAVGNKTHGIWMTAATAAFTNPVVGGTTADARNLISGNVGNGITFFSASNGVGITGALVQGNYIGTNVTGTAAIPNRGAGVFLMGTGGIVGGTAPGAGNLIAGNLGNGIHVGGDSNSLIQGNLIGTDVTGTLPLGNGNGGISTDATGFGDSVNLTIGGTTAAARNIISANARGINLSNAVNTLIQGNYIGTDITGSVARGNAGHGIHVLSLGNMTNLTIGGTTPGAGNVISANGTGNNPGPNGNEGPAGIFLHAIGTISGTVIENNLIGTAADGVSPLGNSGSGVFFTSTSNSNTIRHNTITYNSSPLTAVRGGGVVIRLGTGNLITENSIYQNKGLGIDLGYNGVTLNDLLDPDTGPNNLQNYPTLTSVVSNGGFTTVAGTLYSAANTTYRVEFFASAALDASGYGEGQTFLGSLPDVLTNGSGNPTFTASFPKPTVGQFITATATNANNTSEFSGRAANCVTAPLGLANWWPGEGDATDIRGGNNGTLQNGAGFEVGEVGRSFNFDGSNDSVQVGSSNLGTAFSVEFWIMPTNGITFEHLVSNNKASTTNYGALFFRNSHVEYWQAGITRAATPVSSVPQNTWSHVAMTYDGSVDRLYVNGVLQATSTAHSETFNNALKFGHAIVASDSFFRGRLDEVSLFNRALSGAEISSIFQSDFAGKCQNSAPVADYDGACTLAEDGSLAVAAPGVLDGDTDPDGNPLTAVLVDGPAHAASFALYPDGSFNYAPTLDFNGTDSFSYKANDGQADSNTAVVSLTVSAINDAPSFVAGSDQTVLEDVGAQSVSGWATGISAGPSEEAGQMLAFEVTSDNPSLFAIQPAVLADGTLMYTPAANANGNASVTVTLRDNGGSGEGVGNDTSAPQIFTITVTPVNDTPVLIDDTAATDEDSAVIIAVLANDRPGPASAVDEATQTLAVVELNSVAATLGTPIATEHGSVVLNSDGTVTYTPAANYNGPDSFTYTARDSGMPPEQATAGGTVLINPVNDRPVATDGSATTIEDAEPGVTIDLRTLVSGVETAADDLTYTIVNGPSVAEGTLTATGTNGVVTFTPALNFNGDASLTYQVTDTGDPAGNVANALTSTVATVTVHVAAVNDAPLAGDDSFAVDEGSSLAVVAPGVLASDSDVDSGLISAQLVDGPHARRQLHPQQRWLVHLCPRR